MPKYQEPPAIGECVDRVLESVGLVAHGLPRRARDGPHQLTPAAQVRARSVMTSSTPNARAWPGGSTPMTRRTPATPKQSAGCRSGPSDNRSVSPESLTAPRRQQASGCSRTAVRRGPSSPEPVPRPFARPLRRGGAAPDSSSARRWSAGVGGIGHYYPARSGVHNCTLRWI